MKSHHPFAWFAFAIVDALGLVPVPAAEPPSVLIVPPAAALTAPAVVSVTNRFEIRGMHCQDCAKGITREVRVLPGVKSVEVSYPKKLAVVAYDTNRVTQAELVRVIHEAGYEAVALKESKGSRP